jgi:hypothetical protein
VLNVDGACRKKEYCNNWSVSNSNTDGFGTSHSGFELIKGLKLTFFFFGRSTFTLLSITHNAVKAIIGYVGLAIFFF